MKRSLLVRSFTVLVWFYLFLLINAQRTAMFCGAKIGLGNAEKAVMIVFSKMLDHYIFLDDLLQLIYFEVSY